VAGFIEVLALAVHRVWTISQRSMRG
jgi:hypothetical protein